MNDITIVPGVELETKAQTASFAQTAVLRIFERMTNGCLRLNLPDGSQWTFGSPGSGGIQAHIRVRNTAFFQKCPLYGDVGLGESFVEGDWETDSIKRVVEWVISNGDNLPQANGAKIKAAMYNLFKYGNRMSHWLRPNSRKMARRNIAKHYDLGNDFYRLWLDPSMTYSSAYFQTPEQSLEDAQWEKYDALCKKLRLCATDEVLEIGSGWGGFACHAVKHYGCKVTTVTISQEQWNFAKARIEREGVAERMDFRLQDYRDITGKFDKIVSIEMMEALGDRYLPQYFEKINALLKPNGLVGLQYITVPDAWHATLRKGVDWIQKHIFPGSLLLSVGRVNEVVNRTGNLFLQDLHDFGGHYVKTLNHWWTAFNQQAAAVRAGWDSTSVSSANGTITCNIARRPSRAATSPWCKQFTRGPTIAACIPIFRWKTLISVVF